MLDRLPKMTKVGGAVTAAAATVALVAAARRMSPAFDVWCFRRSMQAYSRVTSTVVHVFRGARKALGVDSSGSAPAPGGTVSPVWLRSALQASGLIDGDVPRIVSVELQGDAPTGGFVGEMSKIRVTYEGVDDADTRLPRSFVIKTVKPERTSSAATLFLGHAREGLWYAQFAMRGGKHAALAKGFPLPRVYYADGNTWTGTFLVLMEDLSDGVPVTQMLGNQCWGPPPRPIPSDVAFDHASILDTVFMRMADIHAQTWQSKELLQLSWLKNVEWLQGRDRARWELGVRNVQWKWQALLEASRTGKSDIVWPKELIEAMDAMAAATSWEGFLKNLDVSKPSTAWCWAHGDFHAGNMIWARPSHEHGGAADDGHDFYMVDFAEVGVFSPFVELAQYMVSNATIEVRRAHERRLFERYHARLVERGVSADAHPLEDCWLLYQAGGVERWLQHLTLLGFLHVRLNALPADSVRWFCEQVRSFVADHRPAVVAAGAHLGAMSSYCLVD